MGYIMYFDEDMGLDGPHRFKDHTIIIDPQWVIYAFRRLITNPKNIEGRGSKRMVMWENYVTDGQLTTPFINELWRGGKEEMDKEDFLRYKDTLLMVMERLGLLAPPVAFRSHTDCPENLDYYIVPSMLSDVDQTWVDNVLESDSLQRTATLRLTLGKQFISLPVFHKLLAACLTRFKIASNLDVPESNHKMNCIKKGFGCLEVTAAWTMILSYDNSAINVILFTYSNDDSCIKAGVGLNVRTFLEETIIEVLRLQGQNTKNLACKYFLCLGTSKANQKVKFVRKEDIDNMGQDEQIFQAEGRYLRKTDLKPWFCSEEEVGNPIPVAYFLPPHYQNLSPSDLHLSRISSCMSLKDKMSFGLELGLENHHITTILNDCKGTVEQAYQILAKWKMLHSKGKIGDIIKAMKKLGLDCKFFYKKGKVFD
ncbi:uncharacterized protein LOC110462162 [Mizuhopecten yessoensis]|uniref:uncharacterized protein LOC110462162 n=1 Tax=Mizuhopecten yessoensis TaxID=6573 RepID=UPI000B458FDC|nr:uncharacterized protein LOC110462162 [Mizuhopecten yessoensis]